MTEQTNPPELSEDGKRNAYIFLCKDVVGTQQYYAVCLNKIKKRKDGPLPAIYSDCSVAISKKRCPALAMRERELKEGKAMFFIERKIIKGIVSLVDKAKEVLGSLVQNPPVSTKNEQAPKMDNSYAAALTKAAQREREGK